MQMDSAWSAGEQASTCTYTVNAMFWVHDIAEGSNSGELPAHTVGALIEKHVHCQAQTHIQWAFHTWQQRAFQGDSLICWALTSFSNCRLMIACKLVLPYQKSFILHTFSAALLYIKHEKYDFSTYECSSSTAYRYCPPPFALPPSPLTECHACVPAPSPVQPLPQG